jgi:hypothetical protein
VLGANGGRAFSANRCLVQELRWAKKLDGAPAFYANTGNPGPMRSKHWPVGQWAPFRCSGAKPNSLACSFDYGWDAARNSFTIAAHAAQRLHHVSAADAYARVANVDWWLDVETMNTWQTLLPGDRRASELRDTIALAGSYAALRSAGVRQVGIYSTRFQWKVITGGPAVAGDYFRSVPVWLAGFRSHAHAIAGCEIESFTGGSVLLTQYLGEDGFDTDVSCG